MSAAQSFGEAQDSSPLRGVDVALFPGRQERENVRADFRREGSFRSPSAQLRRVGPGPRGAQGRAERTTATVRRCPNL
jgi:hypothetical protein